MVEIYINAEVEVVVKAKATAPFPLTPSFLAESWCSYA